MPFMQAKPNPFTPGGQGEPQMDENDDTDALLEELQKAEDAGEQYSADSFFAPVPGAVADGGANGGALDAHGQEGAGGQLDPEKLQQLLAMLKDSATQG